MTNKKVGDLVELVISKRGHIIGDEVDITIGKKRVNGKGKILKYLIVGTVLMKVIIEIKQLFP